MIIYKKADVILTLGSRNTLIPLHGTPSKVIFRTLRILMSMMIDLFIHQWREIFIWTMPSDQTTPRALGRFSNLFSGHNKGRDITVRAYYKVSEKKMMNREILSEVPLWFVSDPVQIQVNRARPFYIRLDAADSNRFFIFSNFPWGGVCQWCTCRRQLVERLHLIVVLTFKGLIDCSVHIS